MPGAARLGDKAQVNQDAHGCPACPHPGVGPAVTSSTNVFINKRGAVRLDDLGVHAICCGPNTFQTAKGSPNVYVNGKPLIRKDDKTKHCGGDGKMIEGSADVLINDGAGASGLGSYVMQLLKMLLEKALENKKKEADKHSDQHKDGGGGGGAGKGGGGGGGGGAGGGGDLAKDEADDKKFGTITAARWSMQRALNGQEVELQIECKEPKGQLQIEIWARSADRAQDKIVKKESASASAQVKKKVKLDIPPDAAGGNECHFYFVVKDDTGGERKSEPIFVDRAPFRFSV